VVTAPSAMLETIAAFAAVLSLAVVETAARLRLLPAGDERRQAIDIAIVLDLRLLLRTILAVVAVLAELLLALIGLLARRIRLLRLRLRREAGLGAECGELTLGIVA
jgi:hypothetical protein